MNGPHDLGGKMGFGPVRPEADEPLFHEPWERRAFGLVLAMGRTRQWNIDSSRHARERIAWPCYLSSSYYEIWLAGLDTLMAERGMLDGVPRKLPHLGAADVTPMLARGSPYTRPAETPTRFAAGDLVRAKNLQPEGHTRLPGYLRGAPGTVVAHRGAHVFPDSNAHGLGENPQHLYTVRFRHGDVFGGASQDELHADLFEPYLDRA